MQGTDQAVNGGQAVLFRHLGQVSIASGGAGTGMAEQILNLAQAQATFEQMGGKTVSEGMDRDFFLMPHSLTNTFMATCVLPRFIWVVA